MLVLSSGFYFDVSSEFHFDSRSKDDKVGAGLDASSEFAKSSEFQFDEFRVLPLSEFGVPHLLIYTILF